MVFVLVQTILQLLISYIQDIQDVYVFESILSNTKNECNFLHNEIS